MNQEKKDNKQSITVRFKPDLVKRLDRMADVSGLKKTTIIEQGTEKRLTELDKIFPSK